MRASAALVLILTLAGCAAPLDSPTSSTSVTTPGDVAPTASTPAPPAPTPPAPSTLTPAAPPPERPRFVGCSGAGPVRFENGPMRLEDLETIIPYGLVVGAHVTPIDHMYFAPPPGTPRDAFEVRAVADGVIYEIQPRDINVDTGAARAREWRMDIAHTCTFTTYFDLITSLAPELEAQYDATRERPGTPWEGIPVKAGQLVGRIGAQTLDFGAYDYNVTLAGFVVPEHYDYEPWKVHTVDPFPYFDEPLRSQLLAKALRTLEPLAGKIDWDVDGAMRGNWFAVGTRWYQGLDQRNYWEGHLAIVPHHLDPDLTLFSVGNWSGQARQHAIEPPFDSADVTASSGTVKLVLHQYGTQAGRVEVFDRVEGVALVEMTGPRLLKVELFPGRAATDELAFGPAARLYER